MSEEGESNYYKILENVIFGGEVMLLESCLFYNIYSFRLYNNITHMADLGDLI